jgi:hypothetical protein
MLPATQSGSICPQRNHRSTPSLQPVSTLQQLTQSLPLSVCWATALGWANTALMQWAHGCATHSHRQTGHSPSATSTTAGQSLRPLHLPTLGLPCQGASAPELATATSAPLSIHTALSRAPHIHKGVITTLTFILP